MTCEIAVMNREAVALAADSAETVLGQKVFPSAEKLLSLSRKQPVGIMIYGDADISGVPWETIVKRYRDKLDKDTYDSLSDYGRSFIEFLETNEDGLIPDEAQESYMSNVISECFNAIINDINSVMRAIIGQKTPISEETIRTIIRIKVNEYCEAIDSVDMYPSIPTDYADRISEKYISNKTKYQEIFENLPISEFENKIQDIAVSIFTHNIRSIEESGIDFFDEYKPKYSSGIVIAGFGEKDTFPSVVTYEIEGMLFNHLKYVHLEEKSRKIELEKSSAAIVAFAQTDMVDQFLWGIDSRLESHMITESMNLFSEVCHKTIKNDRKITEDDKKRIDRKFTQKLGSIDKRFKENSIDFQFNSNYWPTLRVLSILPKDELAMMAETLVNLTSFKRKVSTTRETVGGPIDVAVISRGDGFVWLKRKRYFPRELNPGITE